MPLTLQFRKLALTLALVAISALASAITAKADSVTTIITNPNSGLANPTSPPPYATVTATLQTSGASGTILNCATVGGCINVTVTMGSNSSGGTYQLFGNGGGNGAFGFNIVGSTAGIAAANVTSNTGTGAASGFTFDSSGGNFDGFGGFDLALQGPPASGALDFLNFTVTRTAGFTTANDLFEANSGGYHYAVHVAPTNGNPTGFASDGSTPPQSVPEPASMILLGTGLVGAAAGFRRHRRKNL